jgi:hypothetical protein
MPHAAERPPSSRPDERGSVLLLALAFMTVVMLLVTALITFARTGNQSLHFYEVERTRRYAVSSALELGLAAVAKDKDLGTSTSWQTCAQSPVYGTQDPIESKAAFQVVGPGSYLTVLCRQTPGTTTYVPGSDEPRDVTFEIHCYTDDSPFSAYKTSKTTVTCGSGGIDSLLAEARIRYEIDYSDPNVATRAKVPKIVTWELRA